MTKVIPNSTKIEVSNTTEWLEDLQEENAVPSMNRFVRDWKKTEHPVELKMIYIRHICDVDTVNQSFKIALGYDMVWPSSSEDVQMWKTDETFFTPNFVPNFEFLNAKEETKERRAIENGNPFKNHYAKRWQIL